jgi:hypothetical protein
MPNLLIPCGIGMLSAVAWTVAAGEGASGHGATHGSPGHGGFAGHMRPGGCHPEHMGIFFPSEPTHRLFVLVAGEPGPGTASMDMPIGGVVVGGPEHTIADHAAGQNIHPVAHVAARVVPGEPMVGQATVAGGAESDQVGAATAQPNPPTAKPSPPRPPGAVGPGRRMPGWSGPGRPGPGRPPSLQR